MISGKDDTREWLRTLLRAGNGILRLAPTWVAREDCVSAYRLGLSKEEADRGERGHVTERWIASSITADNRKGPENEGLSHVLADDGSESSLKTVLEVGKDLILGEEYACTHSGLDVLVKVIDFADRIFYHYHQTKEDAALVSRHPKEESYYFPEDSDPGTHPESFFGVHPYIHETGRYDEFLRHIVDWDSDSILTLSRAYLQAPDDGFHLPAGIPHSPGTALTIEIQEQSDVSAALQGLYRGKILPKARLFRDIPESIWKEQGVRAVLDQIDWEKSCDPYFYENRHTPPVPIHNDFEKNAREYWIFYNTRKYSGKRLIVDAGKHVECLENGAYSILVWKGKGRINGNDVEGKKLGCDELIVSYEAATGPLIIENTSSENLELYKFFGPEINPGVPMLPFYTGRARK